MNLIIITALVAVCGAAKLDRTYLPPASAKTAGGSPGSLQTPFAGNSFNNGLGGLPKGSFENDFQGVVVDAAVAGTRGSGPDATGLGAPRISYGSTNSKVGDAAFKTGPAAFRQPDSEGQGAFVQGSQQPGSAAFRQPDSEGQAAFAQGSQQPSGPERPRAAADRAASILRYESEVGPENFHYAFETDNGIVAEENGVATNGVQAQGGFSYTGDDGQVYSVSYTADEGGYQPKGDHLPTPPPIPEEILKSLEQNAREEAAGLVDDGSYDAQKYNVGSDYTENDSTNGKYTHQSSKFGSSAPDATASGTFISQDNQQFEKLTGGQSAFNAQAGQGSSLSGQKGRPLANRFSGQTTFGSGSNGALNEQSGSSNAGQSGQDDEASAVNQGSPAFSGEASFGSRFNGASKRPSSNAQAGQSSNGIAGQSGQINADLDSELGSTASFGQNAFGFGSNSASKGQSSSGQAGHSAQINAASGSNQGSASLSGQGSFGFGSDGSRRPSFSSQSQSSQLTGQSAQENDASGQFGQDNTGSAQRQTNAFESTSAQTGASSQGSGFGNRNEYLPPVNRPQNGRLQARPQVNRPQGGKLQTPSSSADSSIQQGEEPNTSEEAAGNAVPLGQQDLQNESRPQGALTSFGKPATNVFSTDSRFGSSNQNKPSNGRRPSSNGNGFAQGQTSQSGVGARPNEYLPPTSNNQNARPQTQPQRPSNGASQFNQQYNAQASGSFQAPQGRPQSGSAPLSTGAQSTLGSQSQQSSGFQRQPSRPAQNGNGFPSRFSATSAQSTSGFGLDAQKATSQPDTELTTPFETSNDGSSDLQSNIQSSTSVFASSGSRPNGRPTQATFGNQFNSQSAFGAQSNTRPQGSSPRPFGQTRTSAFPTQSSQGQFNQNVQFGNQQQQQPQPQDSFAQNNDAQFSPSTQRPTYQQPQGPDDSYYYNQPSRPFGTPQGSRFPSAPSNQFNRVTQQPSFSQSAQASSSFQNVPSTAIPANQFQGSTRHPRPPTLAPTAGSAQAQAQFSSNFQGSTRHPRPPTLAPTAPSAPQNQFQGAVSGVTQASISPFPSQTPTQATQFNAQAQFGSRPNFQQSQFSQTSQSTGSPFSQKPTRPSFGQQSSTMPSFPQRFGSNKFQSQSQASVSQEEPQTDDSEKPVASPQYTGEIYEYNKPAQTLPPPDSTPASTTGQKVQSQAQFGSQPSRPQFGQTSDEEDQRPASQFNVQSSAQVQGTRPQLGGQPKPQFGQNAQSQSNFAAQSQQSKDDNKPFGALAQSQSTFGIQQGSRPQFGAQASRPQFGQTQPNRFGAQSQTQSSQQPDDESPEPSAQPASQGADAEPVTPQGPKNQFGFISPCCQPMPFGRKPQNQPQGSQTQFGQNSFTASQGFKPEPSSFSGKGEEFEASRQPPSFDEQTGYHY